MPRRVIHVYPDWGNSWPLWETGAPFDTPTPEQLGLSPALASEIRKWYDFWLAHFNWETGWDDPNSAIHSFVTGKEFVEQLRREVQDFADVSDERYRVEYR